jgi:haloalkane dehalogenase
MRAFSLALASEYVTRPDWSYPMSTRHSNGIAYRESVAVDWKPGSPSVLLVHGWPESSYMWNPLLDALADAGYRAVAPDLPGYGDSPADPPGSWEHHTEILERFRHSVDLEHPALVMHDWGVMIGLRWACDHPGEASALVISDGGFFADRRWHGLGNVLRTEGEGEALIDAFSEDGFRTMMHGICPQMSAEALGEYWKSFTTVEGRRGSLELYRSGDFEKLVRYESRPAELSLPALVLWGAEDNFAGVAMADRFHQGLPDSELLILEDTGHFIWDEQPQRTAEATVEFLQRTAIRSAKQRTGSG